MNGRIIRKKHNIWNIFFCITSSRNSVSVLQNCVYSRKDPIIGIDHICLVYVSKQVPLNGYYSGLSVVKHKIRSLITNKIILYRAMEGCITFLKNSHCITKCNTILGMPYLGRRYDSFGANAVWGSGYQCVTYHKKPTQPWRIQG